MMGFSNKHLRHQLLAWALPLFWSLAATCQQSSAVLCVDGTGSLSIKFQTGVTSQIGPAHEGGATTLATRACAANLSWGNQRLVVTAHASQLDLDGFGIDLGDGIPVAAFQIKESKADCCMEYQIYSIEQPPHLLRTIKGGQFFTASDIDVDGQVEIWTNDAVAVDGFENLTLSEFDYAPTVVFRFVRGQLKDVSAEFQPYYDSQIARIRAGIASQELDDFKNSGVPPSAIATTVSTERLHLRRSTKVKVLEIVWAYLYSGRDQEAWKTLSEMWPSGDVDRIRLALSNARDHGVRSQADSVSTGLPRGKKKHTQIFDAVNTSGPSGNKVEIIPPEAILLQRPDSDRPSEPKLLDLVIDRAGKVRSAEPAGEEKWVDPELISAALTWKFIPAIKDGRTVASRLRIEVSGRQ
jgi:hypothetical protein